VTPRALAIVVLALCACFSTPADPNAGRALDLPPSPDAATDGGEDAGADTSPAQDSATPMDSAAQDTGGGG
jgi:hypothetical protein